MRNQGWWGGRRAWLPLGMASSFVLVAGAAVALLAGTGGAADNSGETRPCQRDGPVVEPVSVPLGEPLTVSSQDNACERALSSDGGHRLVLVQTGKDDIDLGPVPVREDGTFSMVTAVPLSARPGLAWVRVTDARPLPCDGTIRPGAMRLMTSCVGYEARLNLEARQPS